MTEHSENQPDGDAEADARSVRKIDGDLSVGINALNTHVLLAFNDGDERLAVPLDSDEAIQLGDALRKAAAMLREAQKQQAHEPRH